MTKEEIIEKYHLKEIGEENNHDLIAFLLEGQEKPWRNNERRNN